MKRKSIKIAILIPLLIVLILGIAAMVIMSSVLSSNAANELTLEIVKAEIDYVKEAAQNLPVGAKSAVSTLAPVIINTALSDSNLDPRGYTVNLMTKVLDNNDDLLAVWTYWERDAFDGNDNAFAGKDFHDSTGRFVPFIYRDARGLHVETIPGYDDPTISTYFKTPIETGRPYLTTPYYRNINGEQKRVITYSYPIIIGERTVGVVGADFSIDKFGDVMSDIRILGDGYVFVLSHTGVFASHPERSIVMTRYTDTWLNAYSTEINRLISTGQNFTLKAYSDVMGSDITLYTESVDFGDAYWLVGIIISDASKREASDLLVFIIVIVGIVLLALVSILTYVIINSKLKTLPALTKAAEAISFGDIEIDGLDDGTNLTKNEVQLLERAFSKMLASFKQQAYILARLAEGDYSSKVNIRSEKDVINLAIDLMLDGTLEVLNKVASAGIQVSDGSRQIAEGAQALAQGSQEQAASVEQLSASIAEIASKSSINAELAEKAAALATSIEKSAEKGSHQMNEMMSAVNDINQAGQSISKVIKVIDEIAFQTNILALNAAVEAARAGIHGKGFAVVAEEVRNLAAKSAEAAKDTGELITNSIEKAELGSRIASETASSLNEIVNGIKESAKIINDIATYSTEQTTSIAQINEGVDQVATVVQKNAATAQQSAASSEEMSSQSALLENLIMQFQLRRDGKTQVQGLPPATDVRR